MEQRFSVNDMGKNKRQTLIVVGRGKCVEETDAQSSIAAVNANITKQDDKEPVK